MFRGTDNIPHNIPHNHIECENILWNTISPIEYCYELE